VTLKTEAVVRRFLERAAEEDTEGVSELIDPSVVWLGTRGGLDANRVLRGRKAFLVYMQEIGQAWERFDIEVERVIVSGDTGVAFLRESARGRDAIGLESETAMVFKIRDGKIAEAEGYLDRDEALQAVGLRE
jgi:ketosteroid isomerase-like protein